MDIGGHPQTSHITNIHRHFVHLASTIIYLRSGASMTYI
jgi:hypothetical protein